MLSLPAFYDLATFSDEHLQTLCFINLSDEVFSPIPQNIWWFQGLFPRVNLKFWSVELQISFFPSCT